MGKESRAVTARGVCKSYGSEQALEGVSFTARAGEALGILGPNGAGKSTLLRIAAGIENPTSGSLQYSAGNAKERTGYLPEKHALYGELTAQENLDFFSAVRGLAAGEPLFGISAIRDKKAALLSKGTKQRLAISRTLMHGPDILLMDEPTNNLDREGSEKLAGWMEERKKGLLALIATHDLAFARRVCGRVIILREGRIEQEGNAKKILG